MALTPGSMLYGSPCYRGSRSSFGLLIWKSKRKAVNLPNQMQGAAHTATTLPATTQPRMICNSDSNVANHVNQQHFIV